MSDRRNRIVRAKDVMSNSFIIVDGLETVGNAVHKLRQQQARCIIVNKRDEDDEFGIVLLSDIAKKVIAPDRSPDRINVYEIMSKPVVAMDPNMNIRYAARLFDNFGLTSAPVIENGEIIGVVAYTDIVLQGLLPED